MSQVHPGPVRDFVEEDDDWIGAVQGAFRGEFLDTVRALPVERLLRLPPPKLGRVPFGHELRVLRRFAAGESVQFDPSALWRLYQAAASPREKGLYRGLVTHEALPRATWVDLLGAATVDRWHEQHLFRERDDGLLCRFSLFGVGGIRLVADPQDSNLLRRVIVGQDSFRTVDFTLEHHVRGRVGRYLDVGPGSGVVLLAVSRHAEACVGLDINPRAVQISRLNAELNGITHCEVHLDDAIENGPNHGRFDLVTWNSPFVFLPEECKDTHYDAYGGELGIEVVLRFLDVLPRLLQDGGAAYVAACGPVFRDGSAPLEAQLEAVARRTGMTIREHITQANWHTDYRYFQEEHGIRRFEHSFLEVTHGGARFERIEAPFGVRLADMAREQAFRVWK